MPSRDFLMGFFNFCGIFHPHPGPAPAGISPGPVQISRKQPAAGRKPELCTEQARKPTERKRTGPGLYSTRSREQATDKPTGRSRAQGIYNKS